MRISTFNIFLRSLLLFSVFIVLISSAQAQVKRNYYQEPTWKPRSILPYADAIHNDFWPASPHVAVSYNDPGFASDRLSPLPPAGVYPRVLMTPRDVQIVQQKLALGDKAPLAFQVMWKRVEASKSAFYALVTNNDSLGIILAKDLVAKAKALQPKLAELDRKKDRDNLWNVERSTVADGNPDPPTEIWDLLQYDYLHKWMSPEERSIINETIAKITYKRISNFLHVPDHFMINNHEGFGMEYLRLMLLIEGQPAFDQELFNTSAHKVRAMLDWFLSKDGMCYESIKGWLNISAFMAMGLRDRDLLKHDHLRAKIRYFQAALRWENGAWKIRDEMRASAFHVIWMMHYFHPADKSIDLLYQSTFSTHPFLVNPKEKWPDPVGICQELLLLFADDGMQVNGERIDWTKQSNIDDLNLPTTWKDNERGYVDVRNSWRKEDLHLQFMCKQDFYYGGHEGSENNRLVLWKNGVNWIRDNDMLAHKASFLQNMLTVDGKGQHWPPAPGNWLGVEESPEGVLAAGDGRIGYSFTKVMQIHPFSFPSAKTGYLAPFAEGNVDMSRDIQVAFQPKTIQYYDGYGHTDYGPWSGETRLIEGYRPYNPMQRAFRTVQVAKGKYPYVLVFDDAQKDEQPHLFSFNLSVPPDAVLVDAQTPEIVFQQTDPSLLRMDDLIIGRNNLDKDATGKYVPKKGDPLCLIRVLWRNTTFGFPVPKLEFMQGHALVTIPAITVSPEFRIMIYPFQYGDPLPKTTWNTDKTQLDIDIADQLDSYALALSDAERTVITMRRHSKNVLSSKAKPARPEVRIHQEIYNASESRYTQADGKTPNYYIYDTVKLTLKSIIPPAKIVYTLDGSTPDIHSATYQGVIYITKTTTFKARVIDPDWVQGERLSDVVTVQFIKKNPSPAVVKNVKTSEGLALSVYEIDTKMYNDKGFFKADLIMMPALDQYKASTQTVVSHVKLPVITPRTPFLEQRKGFYRFQGEFFAAETGLYRFDLESCGPVLMELDKQPVIESLGVFHQQLANRKGEAVLAKGWHIFELVICDPLFWNINSLPEMPVHLRMSVNELSFIEIPSSNFRRNETRSIERPTISKLPAVECPWTMVPGTRVSFYDQLGKRRSPDFLDIDKQVPFYSGLADKIEASTQRETVRVYDGYYYIPDAGTYRFDMPYREGDNAWLGSNQASCQSQLRIDDQIILQHGVPGRNFSGHVYLEKGWHNFSIRLGIGSPTCILITPDDSRIVINGKSLYRPVQVSIEPESKVTFKNTFEMYAPISVKLNSKELPSAEIRYTTDGTIPTMSSERYKDSLVINKTMKLTASAFIEGKNLSIPSVLNIHKVDHPAEASLGKIDFSHFNQDTANLKFNVWTGPHTRFDDKLGALIMPKVEASLLYVDINVARGGGPKAGFKVYDMRLRENAITVAFWFRSFENDGKLISKEGINAFGKGYKTISCSLNNGRLTAMPGRLSGSKIEPGKWYFVVFSADEKEANLYVDGKKVATGAGSKDINTDALDFFTGHHAQIRSLELFDRVLDERDVWHLYK